MGLLRVAAAFKDTECWGTQKDGIAKTINMAVVAQIPCDFSRWTHPGYRKRLFSEWARTAEAAAQSAGWPKPGEKGLDPRSCPVVSLGLLEHSARASESLLVAHLPGRMSMNASWGGQSARKFADSLQAALACAIGSPAMSIAVWGGGPGLVARGAACAQEIARKRSGCGGGGGGDAPIEALSDSADGVLATVFALPQFRAQTEAQELAEALEGHSSAPAGLMGLMGQTDPRPAEAKAIRRL